MKPFIYSLESAKQINVVGSRDEKCMAKLKDQEKGEVLIG